MSTCTDLSPATSLMRAAARHPRRPTLIWFDEGAPAARVLDAQECADAVRRLVTVLSRHGVGAGTRVALVAPNSPWHFLVHAACSWLHAATVPLSPRRPAADVADLLEGCDPVLVLTAHATAQCSAPHPGTRGPGTRGPATLDLGTLAEEVEAAAPSPGAPPPCSEEVATLVHTSGTSGRPKAVELTHANLWWGSQCFREGFEYSPATDVVGVCAPLSHIGGFNGTALDMFSHGGTVVVMRDPFDPAHVLDCVERFHVTTMFLVPTMCRALLRAQERRHADLSSWRLPLVGGDALDEHLAQSMREAGLRPLHVWGMTETSGAGACLHPDTPGVPASSVGLP
ncbi:MAG: class I adenylate-forming enzyme family protein, partial [Pauljensenia sp.]